MHSKRVVTLGKFDGVHIGHRALISRAVSLGREHGMETTAYIIGSAQECALTDDIRKTAMLRELGISEVILRQLDSELKNMGPEEFVEQVLSKELNCGYVVVGENFFFGKDRCADAQALSEICRSFNIGAVVVDTVSLPGPCGSMETVSSTLVRSYLKSGLVDFASLCLKRPYSIAGEIVCGKKLGREIGFPTMNIYPPDYAPAMKKGVYATSITIDGVKYHSVTNVGLNPTVESKDRVITETHVFDFDMDCYGKTAEVEFFRFIRPETRFENLGELKARLKQDTMLAKKNWDDSPKWD